jgi:hypothetical protein
MVPPEEIDLQNFLIEKRRSLSKQIRSRLTQSINEGELPKSTNCEALTNLCFILLSGSAVPRWLEAIVRQSRHEVEASNTCPRFPVAITFWRESQPMGKRWATGEELFHKDLKGIGTRAEATKHYS